MKIARSLVLAVVGTLLLAAASANAASMSPVTKALPNVPCSVTAKLAVSSGVINYGGGLSCAQGVGQKTLDVVPQVYRVVNGHKLWYSISLIGLYQGPTAVNPLRLSSQTRAVAGHIYRLLVYGRVTLSNGQLASTTACSGCSGAPPSTSPDTLSIRQVGRYQAQPGKTVGVPGVPCWLAQQGLEFAGVNNTYILNYNGYSGCGTAANVTRMQVSIAVQVSGSRDGKATWFTISGSQLSTGTRSATMLGLSSARTVYIGHGYRTVASVTVWITGASGTVAHSVTSYSDGSTP